MLFNSLLFLLVFLPLSVLGFYGISRISRRAGLAWLVGASLLFYAFWNTAFVLLLLGSLTFNYTTCRLMLRLEKRGRLQGALCAAGVAANLGLLFYFKYFFHLLRYLQEIGISIPMDTGGILLPLGVSFFTFTQIGYLIDCRAGLVKNKSLIDYALFVTLFPHLIAGPILHHREIIPQFSDPAIYRPQARNIAVGLAVFTIGLVKKVLIADHFALVANEAYARADSLSLFQAWSGVLSYMIQLYFDFSGYSEMALGLALLFNIRFPANFDSPYKSPNIIEFWHRWHMTLTRYLTLYIYNPVALRISRARMQRGKTVGRAALATPQGFLSLLVLPTCVTMLLAGVWHGAGMQYFIFGLLHSCYLIINHAWRLWGWSPRKASAVYTAGCVLLTMLAVIFCQVFFRSPSMEHAYAMLGAMSGMHGVWNESGMLLPFGVIETALDWYMHDLGDRLRTVGISNPLTLAAAFAFVWVMPNVLQIFSEYSPALTKTRLNTATRIKWQPGIAWGIAIGLLAALSLLAINGTTEFLYFQF